MVALKIITEVNEKTWDSFTGTGPLSFDWVYFEKADNNVEVDGVLLAQSAWTVVGNAVDGGFDGGAITLNVAVAGSKIRLYRDTPRLREAQFSSGGAAPNSLNVEFNRLVTMAQDLYRDVWTVLGAVPTEGLDAIAAGLAGKQDVFKASFTTRALAAAASIAAGTAFLSVGGLDYKQNALLANPALTTADGKLWEPKDTITPEHWGAGDGVAAATAINAAIDYASSGGGGTVQLKAGTYEPDTDILVDSMVHLKGAGPRATKIVSTSATNALAITNDCFGSSITDLEIDHTAEAGDPTAGHGVRIGAGSRGIRIANLYIHDTSQYGIGLQSTTTSYQDIVIENVWMENIGLDGIDIKDPEGTNIGIRIHAVSVNNFGTNAGSSQAGFDIRGVASLSDCHIYNMAHATQPLTGFRFRQATSTTPGTNGVGLRSTLTGFSVQGTGTNTLYGVQLNGRRCVVSDGAIDLSSSSASTGVATGQSVIASFNAATIASSQFTATAHGITTGYGPVMVRTTGTLPGGLSKTVPVFIRVQDANTLSFSATAGGAKLSLTAGSGTCEIINCGFRNKVSDVSIVAATGVNIGVGMYATRLEGIDTQTSPIGISDSGVQTVVKGGSTIGSTTYGVILTADSINANVSNVTMGAATGFDMYAAASATNGWFVDNNCRASAVSQKAKVESGATAYFQGNKGLNVPQILAAATYDILSAPNQGPVQDAVGVTGTTQITNFSNTYDGQQFTLMSTNTSVSVDANATILLSADWAPARAGATLTLKRVGAVYYPIAQTA